VFGYDSLVDLMRAKCAVSKPQADQRGRSDRALTRKLYIKTYGCQMNAYDSARMADVLAPLGFAPCKAPGQADLVILNTCHIREKAADKVYSELGRLKETKLERRAAGESMLIAVAGCVAQAEGAEILRRQPEVDMVFGPQSYHRLPELVARAVRQGGMVLEADFPADSKFDSLPEQTAASGVSAFLTVQEGCDKFCTFCVVPYTRGAEYSRPLESIVAEARHLASLGAREIVLLGQNVNAYRGATKDAGKAGLARLIGEIAAIDSILRVRYTTSHPRDMDDDLIAAHREVGKLMPYLHLPVQSGSDRILAAMNRGHTRADYLALVERLRRARPDLALSSDFIVGYPGESAEDFRATLELAREVEFASAFAFKYSPRPGTPAATLAAQIPTAVKEERLAKLQSVLAASQTQFNRSKLGERMPILFEKTGREPGQLIGRSPYLQPVHGYVPAAALGRELVLNITAVFPNSLAGEWLGVASGQPAQEESVA
jgi:tRNA-2-methylthio-N6-dimethylallyladenosine synthase